MQHENMILTINPGSTSTKIAVFSGIKILFLKNIKHSVEELEPYEEITDQFEFRKKIILEELKEAEINMNAISIVMGRGGLIKPVPSGVFVVNDRLKEDLKIGILGKHASNLGGLIADDIAQSLPNAKAYIADPVVVDELIDEARITGHPEFDKVSIFHALNQKAVARKYAKSRFVDYESLNLIVIHLGGGITVGAHRKGKVIDVNQGLDGDGPFSPERAGSLPSGALAKMCFSGKYTHNEIKKMITGKGGFAAYLDTNDAREVEERVENKDPKATLIESAMAFQIAKEIGAMYTVLDGNVDAIIFTGGMAYNDNFIKIISRKVAKLAKIAVYPGEDEMESLAMNGLMVLNDEIKVNVYE